MNNQKKSWYVARWPFLAWVETAIKLVALGIGSVAFVQSISVGRILLAAIFDRLTEREIVAMVFVIINNLGHWGMTFSLASGFPVSNFLLAFCSLMLIGDLIKLVFIRVHNFSVRDRSGGILYGLTSVYIFGYAVILILEFIR